MSEQINIIVDDTTLSVSPKDAISLLHELAGVLGAKVTMPLGTDSPSRIAWQWLTFNMYHECVKDISRTHTVSRVWNLLVGHGYGHRNRDNERVTPIVRCNICMRPARNEDDTPTHNYGEVCTARYGDCTNFSVEVSSLIESYDSGFLKKEIPGKVSDRILDRLITHLR